MTTEDLIALIKKNKISFGCGALSLILAIFAYLRSDAVPAAQEELKTLSAESERLSGNIEYSSKLAEQYKTLVTANQIIDSRLVHSSQLAQNLQYFYKLESDTNTKLIDLHQNPSPQAKKGVAANYTPVGFGISVDCDYAKAIDVLRQLESGVHYCRITTCLLGPKGPPSGLTTPMTLQINLELEGKP